MDKYVDIENGQKISMPYTVPEDFFDQLEEDVLGDIHQEITSKPRRRNIIVGIVLTIAACLAIFLVLYLQKPDDKIDNFAYVEEAFGQLNTEDQAYILDTYQSDVFFNE